MIRFKKREILNGFYKYYEYFKIGLKNAIEYKAYFLSSLFYPLLVTFIYIVIWEYIFTMKSNGDLNYTIGGFTYAEMIVYILITQLIGIFKSFDFTQDITQIIKSGDIVIYLSRPVNFVKSLFFKRLGRMIPNLFAFIATLFLVSYMFKLYVPNYKVLLVFVSYGFLLILFYVLLNIIIGGFAFWLTETWGIGASFQQFLWVLSGNALPLSIFPRWLFQFLQYTPFFYLDYSLASIYLGKLTLDEALGTIAIFLSWIVILIIIVRITFNKGLKKLVTLGG